MKIVHFSWESLHSVRVGEISTAVTELAAAQERLGNEVHVFTRIGPEQKEYEVIDGVHYHRCPFGFDSSLVQEMYNMSKSITHRTAFLIFGTLRVDHRSLMKPRVQHYFREVLRKFLMFVPPLFSM